MYKLRKRIRPISRAKDITHHRFPIKKINSLFINFVPHNTAINIRYDTLCVCVQEDKWPLNEVIC